MITFILSSEVTTPVASAPEGRAPAEGLEMQLQVEADVVGRKAGLCARCSARRDGPRSPAEGQSKKLRI